MKKIAILLTILCLLLASCASNSTQELIVRQNATPATEEMRDDIDAMQINKTNDSMMDEMRTLEIATFAGGCFWCMEPPFEKRGLVAVSGYTGGDEVNPTYQEVSSGNTGHIEAVQVTFDPSKITYQEVLDIYWHSFDPTDDGGSFKDRGYQYTSAIWYHNQAQKEAAEASLKKLNDSNQFGKPIVTPILPAKTFYKAESYHQDYYIKNPTKYELYRYLSGRDAFIERVWKTDATKAKLLAKLTPIQYQVTQNSATEKPFDNAYWDNHKDGIYVDIVDGKPLFSSLDKYDSGTGWPSFTKPLVGANIMFVEDKSLLGTRTEVRSTSADSHLGHVFNDGPKPDGLRYCMNSASLRFIAAEDLDKEGYAQYKYLFVEKTK